MSEVTARLNKLRLAPRKVRLISNLLKGKDVIKALYQLEHLIKKPAPYLVKLINSAIANAENNFNMVKSNLFIKDIIVNEGVKLMRFRPKGFGRTSPIQKKTSHIKIVLGERITGLKADKKSVKKEEGIHEHREINQEHQIKKPEIKTELGKKRSGIVSLGRRIFQRKSI